MEITRKLAKDVTAKLTEKQIGKELYNLLLIYSEGEQEDEGLKKEIESIIKTRKDLVEILSNVSSYESEIVRTQRIKDFFACIEYIKSNKNYKHGEGIILEEFEFTQNSDIIHHLSDGLNLTLGFLGEILSWIDKTHGVYNIMYYVKPYQNDYVYIRVSKQHTPKHIPEYNDRGFAGHNVIHSLCALSGKTVFELFDIDENQVRG